MLRSISAGLGVSCSRGPDVSPLRRKHLAKSIRIKQGNVEETLVSSAAVAFADEKNKVTWKIYYRTYEEHFL